MQKYIVLYKVPVAVLDGWMQTSQEVKDAEEQKMQQEWNQWMQANTSALLETAGVGKPTVVSKEVVVEGRNDIMMYSIVQAESLDMVQRMFSNHPHLHIPEATIEILLANPINI